MYNDVWNCSLFLVEAVYSRVVEICRIFSFSNVQSFSLFYRQKSSYCMGRVYRQKCVAKVHDKFFHSVWFVNSITVISDVMISDIGDVVKVISIEMFFFTSIPLFICRWLMTGCLQVSVSFLCMFLAEFEKLNFPFSQ